MLQQGLFLLSADRGAMHRFAFLRTHPDVSSSSSSTNQTASHAAEKHFNAPDKMSLGECRSLQDLDRRWRPACPDQRMFL